MKRLRAGVAMAIVMIAAFSSFSLAGPNSRASIGLHVLGPTWQKSPGIARGLVSQEPAWNPCTRPDAMIKCESSITHGNLYPAVYYVHVLVFHGDATAGIAGLQFGISYGSGRSDGIGIDIYSWQLCATMEFQQPSPVWPESGGGNLITWDWTNACQRYVPSGADGVTANAGFFYMAAYSPADLAITVRPVDGYAKVASCAAEEDVVPADAMPSRLGVAGFGAGRLGYAPCPWDPVEQTTWSAVKSLYGGR